MKKIIIASLLTLTLALSLVACGESKSETEKPSTPPKTEDKVEAPKPVEKHEEDVKKNPTTPSKSEKKTSRLYFFDMEKMEIVYVDKEITVNDGALVTALTKAQQENTDNEDFVKLTSKVGVSRAKLENGILNVYFNDDFTKHMNLGSSSESGLISGLVNTYGYNFGVDKVAIYCNNKLYTGLRGELPEGYYKVDIKNAVPYKK